MRVFKKFMGFYHFLLDDQGFIKISYCFTLFFFKNGQEESIISHLIYKRMQFVEKCICLNYFI